MGRILAIDYGRKRCGVAVTDCLKTVGTPLATVPTHGLLDFLTSYLGDNDVEEIVVGEPVTLRGEPSESARYIEPFIGRLRGVLPAGVRLSRYDERFTSAIAHRAMIDSGMRRKQRQDKSLADRMAATIILNDYLQSIYR